MRKKGGFSYEDQLGRWWLSRSLDGPHRRAYRNIADFIRDSFPREPGTILDYACGAGDLLSLLSLRFRHSRLLGLDGSTFLLGLARRRISALPEECAGRISLIQTALPNFRLLRGKANLVIFCFPNMVPFSGDQDTREYWKCLTEDDRKIAKNLLIAADPEDQEFQQTGPGLSLNALEQGRCISFNLRRLLAQNGVCVRIEYATAHRHELSPVELALVSFEEGSLETKVDGLRPRLWFRLLASAYFRSRVLGDVFDQTGDERDKNGGYLITVLRAV